MITCKSVYSQLLDLIRKDKRSRNIDVDEFNNLLPILNWRLWNKFNKDYEKDYESSNSLAVFKVFNEPITLSEGIGELPDDYGRLIGEPRFYDGDNTIVTDVVTAIEYSQRSRDALTKPTTTHPVCFIANQNKSFTTTETPVSTDTVPLALIVKPSNVDNLIYIDYLREPTTPFLDYYVNDTTLDYTYLDEDATGVAVPLGSTYRDGTAGATSVASQTVDLEWDEDLLPVILGILCQMVGVTLADQNLYQAGTIEETK
jgi:hypothetical protein